jgi:hypothetical protein
VSGIIQGKLNAVAREVNSTAQSQLGGTRTNGITHTFYVANAHNTKVNLVAEDKFLRVNLTTAHGVVMAEATFDEGVPEAAIVATAVALINY